MSSKAELGKVVDRLIDSSGLSQREFLRKAKLGHTVIHNARNMGYLSRPSAIKILDALGASEQTRKTLALLRQGHTGAEVMKKLGKDCDLNIIFLS